MCKGARQAFENDRNRIIIAAIYIHIYIFSFSEMQV